MVFPKPKVNKSKKFENEEVQDSKINKLNKKIGDIVIRYPPMLYAKIQFNDEPGWVMIDSGCQVTTVGLEWAKKRKWSLKPIGKLNVIMAEGNKRMRASVSDVFIKWLGVERKIRVIVLDGDVYPLLGLDVLTKFKVELNFPKKTVKSEITRITEQVSTSLYRKKKLKGANIKRMSYGFGRNCNTPQKVDAKLRKIVMNTLPRSGRLRPKATMQTISKNIIPAQTSMKIKVKIRDIYGEGPFLFEPNSYLRSRTGCSLFNLICDIRQRSVFLTNFTRKDILIPSRTVVARGYDFTPAIDNDDTLMMTDENGKCFHIYSQPFAGCIEVPYKLEVKPSTHKLVNPEEESQSWIRSKNDIALEICRNNYADLVLKDVFDDANQNKIIADYPTEFSLEDQKCVKMMQCVIANLEVTGEDFDEKLDRAAKSSIEAFTNCLNVGNELKEEERFTIGKILIKFKESFTTNLKKVIARKKSKLLEPVRIDTGDAAPVSTRYYRKSPEQRDLIEMQVQEMLDAAVIEPSKSAWCSPVVLVEKKGTSKKRFCIDFRKLNALTKTETFPIPRIDDALDSLAGSKLFSTLDFNNAYWQLPLHHKSKEKTAFSTMSGNYQFSKMPFGLKNAVAAFCRTISNVLGNLKWNSCFVYLDDIVVFCSHNRRT